MSKIIEIVFENVSKENANPLFNYILSKAEDIKLVHVAESISREPVIILDDHLLDGVINSSDDASIIVKSKSVVLKDVFLPELILRLIKYDNMYDIDLNFDSINIDMPIKDFLVNKIHPCIKDIASEYAVSIFFCGVDPAADEDTRYFTGKALGPLSY